MPKSYLRPVLFGIIMFAMMIFLMFSAAEFVTRFAGGKPAAFIYGGSFRDHQTDYDVTYGVTTEGLRVTCRRRETVHPLTTRALLIRAAAIFDSDELSLCQRTASAIADGKVVGWFQGRTEWGPRALGNRSILCDPRRADMKTILNAKIKRRESFRPFAPSVLKDAVSDWFEEDDDVSFMMQVFQIQQQKRGLIPAVTHVDGSGRLQTVTRRTNPRYYKLIEIFRELTGVPMVLNTSFNENEPIVCEPHQALDCFLRTKMDVLVMNNIMISRTEDEQRI